MKRFVVYTAIFNDYDWLKDPYIVSDNVDYVCFTDSHKLKSKIWKIVIVEENGISPSMLNRKIKLLYPYTFFNDYEYSLYVDGSVMIKGDVYDFVNKYLEKSPLLMNFQHPDNDCIFIEIENCIKEGRGNKEMLKKQYEAYKSDGMPEHYGLSDNKIILRKNCKQGFQLMTEWFEHVCNYSGRDQVCLSYVLWKNGLHYCFFDEVIEQNKFFETWPHNVDPWYMRVWRRMKWFSERKRIGWSLFCFLNNKVKPVYLKLRGIQ